jgi:hypothetical protein
MASRETTCQAGQPTRSLLTERNQRSARRTAVRGGFGGRLAVRGEGTERGVLRHRQAGVGEASDRLDCGIAGLAVPTGSSSAADAGHAPTISYGLHTFHIRVAHLGLVLHGSA